MVLSLVLSACQPRMRLDGGFAAIAVVIEKLLANFNVTCGEENEVRSLANAHHLRVAVAVGLAVVEQSSQATTLSCGVHTATSTAVSVETPAHLFCRLF